VCFKLDRPRLKSLSCDKKLGVYDDNMVEPSTGQLCASLCDNTPERLRQYTDLSICRTGTVEVNSDVSVCMMQPSIADKLQA
jgi:hypothetical protein